MTAIPLQAPAGGSAPPSKARPATIGQPGPKMLDRFWMRVEKGDGCWNWVGALTSEGYGQLKILRRHFLAHRFVFDLMIGQVPPRYFVCHRCDNRRCVNPEHLFLGTAADNNGDMTAKGRRRSGDAWVPNGQRVRGVTRAQVQEIRSLYKGRGLGPSQAELARRFGVSQTHIGRIVSGNHWPKI
jgi:hypothetical protein